MNALSDLIRLEMLLDSISKNLREIAKLKDNRRVRMIRTVIGDVGLAQWYWKDGRVTGMTGVMGSLASVRATLANAASTGSAVTRSTLVTEAHRAVLSALHEVKARTQNREEVANVG